MARSARQRNGKLLVAIKACGWSYDAGAAAVRAIARENNDDDLRSCDRSHVGHWVAGVQPRGLTPNYITEAASGRLGHGLPRNSAAATHARPSSSTSSPRSPGTFAAVLPLKAIAERCSVPRRR